MLHEVIFLFKEIIFKHNLWWFQDFALPYTDVTVITSLTQNCRTWHGFGLSIILTLKGNFLHNLSLGDERGPENKIFPHLPFLGGGATSINGSGCHGSMSVTGAWVGSMSVTGAWNQCFWLAKTPVSGSGSGVPILGCVYLYFSFLPHG